MGRYSRLHRIQQMDPHKDYEQIFRWVTEYEFPWDYLQGVSVAFLRDYGVPRISRLLDRTQEFERAGQKRYDDTVLIAHEMVREGMESEHGRAAVRHLNRIHGRYRIPNEDYLYVLATTVVGPKRWIDRYGWRQLSTHETESLALVGRRMGEMMGLTDLPSDYTGFARLHDTYEQAMFAYDPANRRVAAATLRVVTGWYPNLLRPLVARASLAVLDEPLLTALGFAPQPRPVRATVHRALRARAAVIRRMPARPDWWPYRMKPRSYPFGWRLDDLGPHWAHTRDLRPLPDERPADFASDPHPQDRRPPWDGDPAPTGAHHPTEDDGPAHGQGPDAHSSEATEGKQ
ncbi:oxygenase MpaB family protein [Streptomyces fructofermentans]|uniref:Peptidase n=2 Tax=Streptomyces fructofermentans TaxID=152141 RepID=A0A918KWS2_9ACTN|nr:oxygenase MpaB family protein [Streptomyces fructofermentans]GGX76797.1 peptidase [Streptomyces fructofermentans]